MVSIVYSTLKLLDTAQQKWKSEFFLFNIAKFCGTLAVETIVLPSFDQFKELLGILIENSR